MYIELDYNIEKVYQIQTCDFLNAGLKIEQIIEVIEGILGSYSVRKTGVCDSLEIRFYSFNKVNNILFSIEKRLNELLQNVTN